MVAVAGLAWLAGGFASFTWQATASVVVGGAAVLVLGRAAGRPGDGGPPDARGGRPRGTSAWTVWALAFLCWWGTAFLTGSRPSHPTLSLVMDPVLEVRPLKAAAFLVWLVAGWWLVRR